MKKIKGAICVLLLSVIMLSFISCDNNNNNATEEYLEVGMEVTVVLSDNKNIYGKIVAFDNFVIVLEISLSIKIIQRVQVKQIYFQNEV